MTINIVTVGAQINGHWVQSDSELLEALTEFPWDVDFWAVDPFTRGLGQHFYATDPRLFGSNNDIRLHVLGPNPWLGWKWSVNLEPRYLYQTDQWRLAEQGTDRNALYPLRAA